jgi:V8-like Glu-specific endopeptidase
MAPLPEGRVATPLVRGTDFEGQGDAELQALLVATGAVGFTPIHDGADPAEIYEQMATAAGASAMTYVGVVTAQGHYLVEVDDEALAAPFPADDSAAPGASDGQEPIFDDPNAPVPTGWSGGADSRTRRTGSGIPSYAGLVSANGQCTGALIGSRIVRTAAHCVITPSASGGSVVGSATFDFRRDATTMPVTATTSTILYGGGYIPAGCGTSSATDSAWGYRNNLNTCRWKDWAYLILPSGWNGSTYYTWLGYRKLGSGELNLALDHGGYPGCGTIPDRPAGCVSQAFYRDTTSNCKVYAWTSATAKWRSSCDNSPGHSGGAAVNGGQLIGHFQWYDCATCPTGATNRDAPNHFLGHDDWLYNYQQTLRTTYR